MSLSAQQVEQKLGISRAELLAYERAGKLTPQRTPGNHRRYDENEIARVTSTATSVTKPAPNYTELGVTALNRWGGSIYEEPLAELRGAQGRKLLREMHWNDPVINAVFFAIEASLKQASWRIKPASESEADKECAKFVEDALNGMLQPFMEVMDFIIDPMLEQGVSILEVVFKRGEDGRVTWKKWGVRPVESLSPGNEWDFDKHGEVLGCYQDDPETGETNYLPVERLLMFRTTAIPANSPEGTPIHRGMYTSYYYGKNFQEIEGIGVERDLGGIPVMYLGVDCNMNANDPLSDFSLAKNLVVNLRADDQAGVVLPKPKMGTAGEGQGMLLELLSANSTRAHDVSAIIERYDRQKALVVLAQFIMLGMSSRGGSFALSSTQSDLFSLAIGAWLKRIADVINRKAIPRLIEYNVFPGITKPPMLDFNDVGLPNLNDLSWYINALMGNNLITPDAELERHLRLLAHLPEPEPTAPNADGTSNAAYANRDRMDSKDSALLIRRVLLALRELPTYENMTDEQLMSLVQPLINSLRASIERETGVKIPPITEDLVDETQSQPTGALTQGEKAAAKAPVADPKTVEVAPQPTPRQVRNVAPRKP